MRLGFALLVVSCAPPPVHTVVIAPAVEAPKASVIAARVPAESATPAGCGHEIRLRVGRVPLSSETILRALHDVREPLKIALCDCMHAATAIVAITPSLGAIEVSGVSDDQAECMRARLVPPAFEPWSLAADCPTCGIEIGVFPGAPARTIGPDSTLFASLRFE